MEEITTDINTEKIYLNRYSDRIIFKRLEPLKFRMSGFMSGYNRRIIDLNGKTITFDPPGGPTISTGIDMGEFDKKWSNLKIETIESEKSEIESIIITCFYDISNMKWETIKNPA